jgi:soluble lytic murein transglycosylase-like protein
MAMQRIGAIENRIQSLNSLVQAPDSDFQKILATKIEAKSSPNKVSRSEIDNLITKYADKNGLDEDFVKAVINQESGFNPNAT